MNFMCKEVARFFSLTHSGYMIYFLEVACVFLQRGCMIFFVKRLCDFLCGEVTRFFVQKGCGIFCVKRFF